MTMDNTSVYRMTFASVYPHYMAEAEKKGRTKTEVDEIIFWLTGYDAEALQEHIDNKTGFEQFFAQAPQINPNVEDIEDPLMQRVRYLDKLIDELAKGKSMEKILRR